MAGIWFRPDARYFFPVINEEAVRGTGTDGKQWRGTGTDGKQWGGQVPMNYKTVYLEGWRLRGRIMPFKMYGINCLMNMGMAGTHKTLTN